MTQAYTPFNRALLRKRRVRAARGWPDQHPLKQELAERCEERLQALRIQADCALDLGCHAGEVSSLLAAYAKRWVCADYAEGFARKIRGAACVSDEEWLPFADNSFDLIVSAFILHNVNDLPGTLIQTYRCLKPGGLWMASIPAEHTLQELREAMIKAANEEGGALAPRVHPLVDGRSAVSLMQRAGFAEPLCDSETITIHYTDITQLWRDLRSLGESNHLHEQYKGLTTPKQMSDILSHYKRTTSQDPSYPVTLDILTLTGWK